ncbi:MAG: OsmC family protein [Verrucomicrobiota bacterium]
MSEHTATLTWNRNTDTEFTYNDYSRDHDWTFENNATLRASAAKEFLGNPDCVDPEAAFVAALASCHMLTFLAIACKKRFTVESYTDHAVGHLEPGPEGRLAITRITLRPKIEFSGEKQPTPEQLSQLHDVAHHECFLANSVTTKITVN